MKQAYDLHKARSAILQKRRKNNVYHPHSNNIHQLYIFSVLYILSWK